MMKRYFAPTVVTVSLLISACGEFDTSNKTAIPDGGRGEFSSILASVCFSSVCLPTSSLSTNAGNDYKYPDNKDFSNASLRDQYRAPYAFLDLNAIAPKTRIAKNFLLNEFVQSSKGRYAILLPIAVEATQAIRDSLGTAVVVTSGYRSPGYNARTPGASVWSRHTYGDGVDLAASSQKALEQQCIEKQASFVLSYADGHVHCDWRAVALDPAFYPPLQSGPSVAFMALSQHLSSQIKIHVVNGELSVSLPEELDLEGDPTLDWDIQPTDSPDTYHVSVIVGGTLRASAILSGFQQ